MATDTFKIDFIKNVMDNMGISLEEAEAMYEELGPQNDSAPKLPFPLAKINNDEGVASRGELVWGPLKDEDGFVYSYENIKRFEDLDIVVLHRDSLYSCYDVNQNKTIAKTVYASVFEAATKRVDLMSGNKLERIKNSDGQSVTVVKDTKIEMTYQQLVLIGIRPKGTKEPLTILSIFLKKVPLITFNRLMDKVNSPKMCPVMNLVTGTARRGNVKYAIFEADQCEVRVMDREDYFANLTDIMTAVKTQREYIKGINKYLVNASDHVETPETVDESRTSLPE